MKLPSQSFHRLWFELKRRKTIKTVIAYLIILAAIVGPTSDILGGLDAPEWILRTIISLLLALFPVVLAISWVFDFTTHGFERTPDLQYVSNNTESSPNPSESGQTSGPISMTSSSSVNLELGTSQRHQITLLRCTFNLIDNGSMVDDPDLLLTMLPAINKIIRSICSQYSATLYSQEGYRFQLLFGYPANIEDETFWAVNAALSLQECVSTNPEITRLCDSLEIVSRMSVHSASVIIDQAPEGAESYTLAGSALEDSAWLQTLTSPGVIVLDSYTQALLRNRVHCISMGYVVNPQNDKTVELFTISNAASAINWPTLMLRPVKTLVGRESELLLLKDRWQRALEGEDEHVVLRGESGIGKTALVNALAQEAGRDGEALVLSIKCVPMMMTSPFYPIVHYFRREGRQIFRKILERIQSERSREGASTAAPGADSYSPSILAFNESEREEVSAEKESTRAESLMRLIDIFFEIMKDKKLLLVFEDLQWADPSTLKVLDLLANQKSRSGALCLYTTSSTTVPEWEVCSNFTILNLEKLSRKATKSLVLSIVGEHKVAPTCLNHLIEEAKGNPFITEELAKAIVTGGTGGTGDEGEELRSTEILKWSFNSRIQKLGGQRPLLQVCSMLGARFSYGLINVVCKPSNQNVLREDLRILVKQGLLEQHGLVPKSDYAFRNRILQQVAYESIPRLSRAKLHKQIVSTIKDKSAVLEDNVESLLTYHKIQAESNNTNKAVGIGNRNAVAMRVGSQVQVPTCGENSSNIMKFPDKTAKQWDKSLLSDNVF